MVASAGKMKLLVHSSRWTGDTCCAAAAVAWIAEDNPADEVTALPDGGALATFACGDERWLRRLLLRYPGLVTPVERPDLVLGAAQEAAQALRAYGVEPA